MSGTGWQSSSFSGGFRMGLTQKYKLVLRIKPIQEGPGRRCTSAQGFEEGVDLFLPDSARAFLPKQEMREQQVQRLYGNVLEATFLTPSEVRVHVRAQEVWKLLLHKLSRYNTEMGKKMSLDLSTIDSSALFTHYKHLPNPRRSALLELRRARPKITWKITEHSQSLISYKVVYITDSTRTH